MVFCTFGKENEMMRDGKISSEQGYRYTKNNMEYVEFHIDDHIDFQYECKNTPYGGLNLT